MPYLEKFKIGDIVEHKKLGRGIIIGCEHGNKDKFTWFHIYYPAHDRFGYYLPASFSKIENAAYDARKTVQQILLNHFRTEKLGKYEFGDVLRGNGMSSGTTLFVLDNGRQYNDIGNIIYLVYNVTTDRLYYTFFTENVRISQKSNINTRKFASKIICNRLLMPIFNEQN